MTDAPDSAAKFQFDVVRLRDDDEMTWAKIAQRTHSTPAIVEGAYKVGKERLARGEVMPERTDDRSWVGDDDVIQSPSPRKFTKLMLDVIRLRDEEEFWRGGKKVPMPWGKIAERTGASMSGCVGAYRRGKERQGNQTGKGAIEATDGKKAAQVLEAVAVPFDRIKVTALAKAVGLPITTLNNLIRRYETRYLPVTQELRKVTTEEIKALLDDRLHKALTYLDDFVFAQANAKDLAIISGIMAEKRAMLRGEPTVILGTEERKSLNALAEALRQELERRTMTPMIDVTPIETPSDQEPGLPVPVGGASNG